MQPLPMPLDEFTTALFQDVIRAIADGRSQIVVWGMTPSGVSLLGALRSCGLIERITGLIDARPALQGQQLFGLQVEPPERLTRISMDTLVIACDQEKEAVLDSFVQHDSRTPQVVMRGNAHYMFRDPVFEAIVASCPVKSKAGGYPDMLTHLYQVLQSIATRELHGDIAEFGVYQGGTTVFLAKVLKHFGHSGTVYGFDTFAGFPERSSILDLYSDRKCEFPDYETVRAYCAPYNIKLIRGDIRETYIALQNVDLVLSFFDTDNYAATHSALELCYERTVPGGILAFDHYYSPNWEQTIGERMAARQVLSNKPVFHLHGTGIFVKL
jgi:O-methyltransferase